MPAWRPRLLRPLPLAATTSGEGVSGTVIWLACTSLRWPAGLVRFVPTKFSSARALPSKTDHDWAVALLYPPWH